MPPSPSQRHDSQASEQFVNGIAAQITDTCEAAKIWADTALDTSANPAESWLRPYGAELKDVVSSVLFATRTPPAASNKYKKRMGAKKAKRLERLSPKALNFRPLKRKPTERWLHGQTTWPKTAVTSRSQRWSFVVSLRLRQRNPMRG